MKIFNIVKKQKLFFATLFFAAIVITIFVVKTKKSEALLLRGFGGAVASITVCTCSTLPTYYVSLGPPTGGELLLTEASEPYAYYDIWGTTGSFTGDTWVNTPSGPWLLGSYTTGVGAGCMMMGEPCYSMPPAQGTIYQYGTSLGSAVGL